MRKLLVFTALLYLHCSHAQDTFSIVAVDSSTGEVGSAGASCLDDNIIAGGVSIIRDVVPGLGAINTQASYLAANQTEASLRLSQGYSATDIIQWLVLNDAAGDSTRRQYGIARFDTSGGISTAAFTGSNCFDEKAHIVGPYYSIQGNILLGAFVLDSMERSFLNTQGSLAERLMAAMQAANIPGADSRCLAEGVSSRSAYLTVAAAGDPPGAASLDLIVSQTPFGAEPIDSLQTLFDQWKLSRSLKEQAADFPVVLERNSLGIRIAGAASNTHISIYSIDGKLLLSQKLESHSLLSDPAPGKVLLLRLSTPSGSYSRRLAP